MSETLAADSKRIRKTTCRACSRTIHMIPVGSGLVAVDPELIAVVTSGKAQHQQARRVHAELCDTYQRQRKPRRGL